MSWLKTVWRLFREIERKDNRLWSNHWILIVTSIVGMRRLWNLYSLSFFGSISSSFLLLFLDCQPAAGTRSSHKRERDRLFLGLSVIVSSKVWMKISRVTHSYCRTITKKFPNVAIEVFTSKKCVPYTLVT